MKRNPSLLRLVVLAMLVAVGVVISPILRVEGMCPTAHLINIVCAVLLGPVYSFVCACTIGVIRMSLMGIPPLALTGAVFGAALSGILYRLSGGRLIFAVIGEVVGTGIIGAVASYPVMTLWWGYTGLTWVYYVPSFIAGTLIGGSVAFLLLKKLAKNGMLLKMQQELETKTYTAAAGGGVVSATVTGKRELKEVVIAPEAVDPEDVEMLQDMIVAAVNEALRAAESDSASTMQQLTGGLGLPF